MCVFFPVHDKDVVFWGPGRSGVAPLLHELRKRFNNGDAFHELLFHLMYETFQLPKMGQVSHWKPYIDTLPTAAELDFPVFYSYVVQ
jgi:hypothetical protein